MYIEKEVNISTLNRKRKIRIFLPNHYEESEKTYPVIYMHDGQNLMQNESSFGGGSWEIDDFVKNESNEEAIIVGIDNGEIYRYNEYSPIRGSKNAEYLAHISNFEHFGGEGKEYLEWLVKELKPMIDQEYRTIADEKGTSLVGSSMGAFITIFAGMYYPDVFGQLGLLSPAFWFNKEFLFKEIEQGKLSKDLMLYISVGTLENNPAYLPDANEAVELLKNHKLEYTVVNGGEHNEETWASQVPYVLNKFIKGE